MSILIKDMEMPKKKNGAVLIVYPDGRCAFENGEEYKAVPVPPHGRLIDADELRDVQQKDADLFRHATTLAEKSRRDEALNAVANIVNAPTVIEAEEAET